MKRIFGKKAAAAIAVLFSASLVCTGCSDGGSSGGGDDSGGGTNVSGGDGSGGETGGGGTEKPTIADGTYCNGMLTVENGKVTKCDPSATGTIEIPEGVEKIEWDAFKDCKSLTSITIPASVERIGAAPGNGSGYQYPAYVFAGFSKLQITVDENNTVYSSDNGILYNKNKTTLYAYPSASGNITIRKGVTEISDYAFYGCTSLASVIIPEGVTGIGNHAFSICTSLTSVTIPEGVTSIGTEAFLNCRSLENATIPEGVTAIYKKTFGGCTNLTSVTIPKSVTKIGMEAFWNCTSLTDVTIPKSVTSIGTDAFEYCTSLTSVTISGSVTEIGISVFRFCHNLKTIYVANKDEIAKWTEEKIGKSGITVKVIGE